MGLAVPSSAARTRNANYTIITCLILLKIEHNFFGFAPRFTENLSLAFFTSFDSWSSGSTLLQQRLFGYDCSIDLRFRLELIDGSLSDGIFLFPTRQTPISSLFSHFSSDVNSVHLHQPF